MWVQWINTGTFKCVSTFISFLLLHNKTTPKFNGIKWFSIFMVLRLDGQFLYSTYIIWDHSCSCIQAGDELCWKVPEVLSHTSVVLVLTITWLVRLFIFLPSCDILPFFSTWRLSCKIPWTSQQQDNWVPWE